MKEEGVGRVERLKRQSVCDTINQLNFDKHAKDLKLREFKHSQLVGWSLEKSFLILTLQRQ